MSRISRHLFLECGLTSLIALVVLSFVVMLPQLLRLVDLWVNKGVAVDVLGSMISLSIPKILLIVIPMALLVGILLSMGRMAQDSELVILKASGISLLQVMRPILLLALLYAGLALLLSLWWLPNAFHQFFILKKALISSTALIMKPQTFNHSIPGLTLYAEQQDAQQSLLHGLLIHDRRKPDAPVTLTARQGEIRTLANGESLLLLQEGTRHQIVGKTQYQSLSFSTYQVGLGVLFEFKTKDVKERLDELSLDELSQVMQDTSNSKAYDAWMEWHRRFSFPVATLILGLFAVPVALQQPHRSGRSYALVVAIVTLILHFTLLSIGETLARKHLATPVSGFWLPNLLMGILTAYLVYTTHQCRSFWLVAWLAQSLANLPQRLLSTPRKAD
ncbi:MAG: LPS export ABC transporter permease LptF [Magnetococcales bacterium]|nr:LPS export ABC transporter permease LptF [Magnetococcales bacterium]